MGPHKTLGVIAVTIALSQVQSIFNCVVDSDHVW